MSNGADESLENRPDGQAVAVPGPRPYGIEVWLPEPSSFFEIAFAPTARELERQGFKVSFRHQQTYGELFIRLLAPDGAALRAAHVIDQGMERLRARRVECLARSAVVLSPDGTQREFVF